MTKDDIQKKIDNISKIYKNNREIPLRILTIICTIAIMFFLSSNMLFKKEDKIITTDLNKIMTLNNVDFSITKRQYNPDTRLIQVNFKMQNKSVNKIKKYNFEVREKMDPSKIKDSKVISIDDENYVLLTTVSKNWGAISISIEDESYKDKKLKLYSDANDIVINTDLVELDKREYKIELCKDDIENIKDEINNLNNVIDEKKEQISSLNNRNSLLEEDKKYQVDSEKIESDGEIVSNNNIINNLKKEIKKLEKTIEENNKKIDKINEKIDDLTNKKQ